LDSSHRCIKSRLDNINVLQTIVHSSCLLYSDHLFGDIAELARRDSSSAMIPWHAEVPYVHHVEAVRHGDSLLSLVPSLFGLLWRHGLALVLIARAFVFALALLWARRCACLIAMNKLHPNCTISQWRRRRRHRRRCRRHAPGRPAQSEALLGGKPLPFPTANQDHPWVGSSVSRHHHAIVTPFRE